MARRLDRYAWTRGFLGGLLVAGLSGCATPRVAEPAPKERVFFPPPPAEARIQFLCHLNGSRDFAVPRNRFLEFLVGKPKENYRTIAKPFGIAVLDHKIFIADTAAPRIVVLDLAAHTFGQFGRSGRGVLRKPINIRVGPDRHLYVTDSLRNQVVVFDETGQYLGAIGDGQQFRPADVLVTEDSVYVLDIADHDIKVYDRATSQLKNTIGKRGPKPGEFSFPTNLILDNDGHLLVCDSMNFRVQKLSRTGEFLQEFGGAGDTPGNFSRPRGLAVDREGIIYVVDAMEGVVQMLNADGQPLMHFGRAGVGDGELMLPAQIFIDYDHLEDFRKYLDPNFEATHLIFVTNQLQYNKVSVFAFGRLHETSPGLVH